MASLVRVANRLAAHVRGGYTLAALRPSRKDGVRPSRDSRQGTEPGEPRAYFPDLDLVFIPEGDREP